jgi:hypothetical protein
MGEEISRRAADTGFPTSAIQEFQMRFIPILAAAAIGALTVTTAGAETMTSGGQPAATQTEHMTNGRETNGMSDHAMTRHERMMHRKMMHRKMMMNRKHKMMDKNM